MKVATAVVELTPDRAVPMGGYDGPARFTSRADGSLEANIALFGEGPAAVAIVSLDLLFAGPDLTRAVCDAFARSHGLSDGQVFVLASHTHFAPMLDRTKPLLGALAEDELRRWTDSIGQAIATLRHSPVTHTRRGKSWSDSSVNRRLRWKLPTAVRLLGKVRSNVYMCDNPAGDRDPWIRTYLWEKGGVPVLALWSFACHPVGFPAPHCASADFIGTVRKRLRRTFGPALPVLFAPSCMGDVRPRSPRSWATPRNWSNIALYGPAAPPFDEGSWAAWSHDLADQVESAFAAQSREPIEGFVGAAPAERLPLDRIFNGTSPVEELTAKAASIPGIGRVAALSCEPVTAIDRIFRRSPEDLVLGYEGNVFGYLPDAAMVEEGGYEAQRFMRFFGLEGEWRPRLDETLETLAGSLAL